MLQIKGLTITHKKDLSTILENFNMVLNAGDKAAIIGEEGNGKSTLMKWVYSQGAHNKPDKSDIYEKITSEDNKETQKIDDYTQCEGELILGNEKLGYLPQELPIQYRDFTIYDFFQEKDEFWNQTPGDLGRFSRDFQIDVEMFYSNQKMKSLSGGEKVKLQIIRILMENPTVLLLDEPSNDIDIKTLEMIEKVINEWKNIVLYISHDEKLIENTANVIVHLERIHRKTKSKYTVAKKDYKRYIEERESDFIKTQNQAINDLKEKKARDAKYNRIMQSVDHAQKVVSRQNPADAKNLKDKMHTIKAMGKRFEKQDDEMTKKPEREEAIFFRLGGRDSKIPAGKTVIEYELAELKTPVDLETQEERLLSSNIFLRCKGNEKICIVGKNGMGKTTLLRKIADELLGRSDLKVEYMPQDYEDILDMEQTPVDFLNKSGDKSEETKIRTYLGSLKYTLDEMNHPMRELSGGQKAKVLLLKMSLSSANVLILDEPTRNFSPLSGPVIRNILKEFQGAIISISHDRKYIEEVCNQVYELKKNGLMVCN